MKHEPRKKKQTIGRLPLGHRALALLLALLMVFTATGMQVFAEGEETDSPSEPVEESTPIAVVEETPAETTTTPEVETTTTPEQTTEETPAETTPSETPDQTTDVETTETPAEPTSTVETTEPSTEPTETPAETQPTEDATTTPPDPFVLTDYIKKSAMNYYVDQTPTDISGQTVTVGSYVSVTLEFGKLEGLEQGQTLTYSIPSYYMTAYQVTESDNAKAYYEYVAGTGEKVTQVIGTYTVSDNLVTIKPDESYLNADTGKIDLPGGQFTFTGKLCLSAGEQSLTFGKADPIQFTVKAATSTRRRAAQSTSSTYDLTDYLTSDSSIIVIIGNKEYTLDELKSSGREVPEGAGVKVNLYFSSLKNIPSGATLTYQIPPALAVQATSQATKLLDSKTFETLGTFIIDETGLIKVTIDDSYHSKYQDSDGTLDLEGFNLSFSGSFSDSAGQVDGSDDNVISFSGTASSSGVSFTIPFDYKNDHANVQIEKTGAFTSATTIKYTVTVKAPDDNIEDAYNVVVTDKITAAKAFIKPDEKNDDVLYRNVTVTNGTFDAETGVWTLGEDLKMKPGQTETLTYEFEVSDDYYTNNPSATSVGNTATVTFNESGKNDAVNQLGTPGTVLLTKEYNDSLGMVKDDKGTYITYTLTATAYGSAQDGIVVSDAFTTKDYVSSIETDGTYQGTVEIDNTAKSVTWTVGSLAEGVSATLTYKAYLDDTAWEKGASFNELFQYLGATKTVKNSATVSVNNGTDTSVEPLVTNTKTTETQIQKKWLVKDSSKIDSGPHSGTVQFTIRANPAPSSDDISTIWDKLTDGTYEDGGVITIKRYLASSKSTKLVDTTEVKVADVLDAGSTTSWTIDLKNVKKSDGSGTVDLSGAYYYEVSYYVVATGVSVTNDAGLGLGNGAGFQITKVAQGASGWTHGTEYYKANVGLDYETGEDKWRVTLKKNVTEGMAVYDTLSTEYVYKNKSYWFDSKTLEGIVVKQGDTVLELNKDYTVELFQDTNDQYYKASPVAPEVRSDGIQINFLHDIEVTGSNYVTIDYSVMFDTAAYSASDTKGFWRANWVGIKVMQFGQLIAQDKKYTDASYSMNQNIPLTKSNGTYHESDGTITWNIEVNKLSTVGGDATLIDLLPEGLTFYSAEIIAMGALAEDNTHRTATTMNGVGKNVVLYAKDCDVEDYSENGKNYSKVSLYIKDLSRFEAVSGGELVKNTYDSVVGTNHNGYAYGRITVQITAKVNPEYLVTLEKKAKITNTAILTDNDYLPEGGVTATGDATITGGGSTVLSKAQATTEAPAYVQFALDINSNALDLVADDGSLSIDDVMGSGMSLATQHRNFVQVYDVTNVSDLYDSDGNVVAEKAATGSDITGQCSWENITTDTSKPTYRFTVPDEKHVVIVYWASFNGAAGQSVQLSNNAYFFYEGKDYTNNSSKWSSKLQVSNAEGSAYTNPYFYLEKTDQWGNNVSGAEFGLYKYVKDGDDSLITTRTTEDGEAYIGKRSTDSFAQLELNTIYAIQEIKAPTGYELDSTEHYFEFATISGTGTGGEVTDQDVKDHQANHPNGITVVDLTPGGTYTVTNTFTGASLTIPIVKTINGKNLSSTTEFSFTLKQTDGDPVYTDSNYKSAVPSTGLTTTITGSGSEAFELYFKSTGNYTFTVTENDLSDTAKKCGYTEKDATTYTLNVTVGEQNGAVAVTSATYSTGDGTASDFTSGSVLTFNNKLSLSGSMKLQVKKTVSGRAQAVQAGEFSFNVLKNGKVITDKDGNELVFYTQQGGLVDITIPLTQDDIGTQDFVIKEIVPTGSDADPSISYTASPIIATVTISEIPATANTTASVAATSDVTYVGQTDSDGVPLMVNKYSATGTLTLHGTKQLYYGNQLESIRAKEFNFVVMEGNTKVATGTTIKELDNNIVFTDINYVAADIGRHTYTITEVNDGELFVEYTDKVVTVTVDVYDKGKGELGTTVAYSGDTDNKSNALFVNTLTFKVPTGIRLDVLPYVLILVLALALGGGALVLRRRKHTKN